MRLASSAACALVLLFAAAAQAAVTATDDSGRQVVLARTPERIVSLAPGATEMLFAAGAGERVIATVEYSDEPPAARRVPRIGDSSAVDIERLVALRPDVVVIWPRGGNPSQIEKVARLGFPLYHQQADALADLPDSLRRLGALANTRDTAEQAAREIETRLAQLASRYSRTGRVPVFLQIWDRPVYTVGGTHLMSDALTLCRARNVFSDLREPALAVDIEAVIARNPEVIVAVAPPGVAGGWLADWRRFPDLKAVRHGRLVAFEDQRLSRLGPSAVEGAAALCEALDAVIG